MIPQAVARRDARDPTNLKLVLIVTILAGAVFVLAASLIALRYVRRRRTNGGNFQQAYLHDPGLTWDEYGRRGRLTRSRLMFESEAQRSSMIRKSQQERALDKDTTATGQTLIRPTRSRSRTWHGHSNDADGIAEQTRELSGASTAAWGSPNTRVDTAWLLLHRSTSPRPHGHQMTRHEDSENVTQHLPANRLQTPPLLSHPLFRDRNPHCRPKHMSLPTEFERR